MPILHNECARFKSMKRGKVPSTSNLVIGASLQYIKIVNSKHRMSVMVFLIICRCWSVDFNSVDTKLLASGSDDSPRGCEAGACPPDTDGREGR